MDREQLRKLTRLRLKDARELYARHQWSGSYHIAGIAVECGLKACIAKNQRKHCFPDKFFANDCFTHDLKQLMKLADLTAEYDNEVQALGGIFSTYWSTVTDWRIGSRYEVTPKNDARDMLKAMNDRTAGVMKWIRKHW